MWIRNHAGRSLGPRWALAVPCVAADAATNITQAASGAVRSCGQALGRLPWLAFFFARALRLRDFLAIVEPPWTRDLARQ